MNRENMLERVATARVARLATVSADGRPHLVPIVYTLAGERIYSVVDDKPKRTKDLNRLRNIRADRRVTLLVDHYADDWSLLWWVRIQGRAEVLASGDDWKQAIDALSAKYPQYRKMRPTGSVIVIDIEAISGWSS